MIDLSDMLAVVIVAVYMYMYKQFMRRDKRGKRRHS